MHRVGEVGGDIVEPDIVRPASVVADREVAAVAIARACIRAGYRGRFYTAVDLVTNLSPTPSSKL